ncbi:hypothetical protein [Rhodanobacter sp. DHB23]|uniref:hypothetical protein n=1 Tax=Rhodanobacter sp. DHB23 TaxID=2775923 RepID=UPI0017820003|nr:hypothetical protein [Rhodanobacter sp. DHB23]MBD8874157.1 hypothetical protein [Rhodanobacter sp. DHB23]
MNLQSAESTSVLACKLSAALDAQLASIRHDCAPEEFKRQRRLFGAAMAGLLDIANAIYREHPGLKPTQMGGPYVLPDPVLAQSVARLLRDA